MYNEVVDILDEDEIDGAEEGLEKENPDGEEEDEDEDEEFEIGTGEEE